MKLNCYYINSPLMLKPLIGVFERSFSFLSFKDNIMSDQLKSLPDGFKFSICIENVKCSEFIKHGGIFITNNPYNNLEIRINTPCWGLLLFTGSISLDDAFGENLISLRGDIGYALTISRAIKRLNHIIFPSIITRKIEKQPEPKTPDEVKLMVLNYLSGLKQVKRW